MQSIEMILRDPDTGRSRAIWHLSSPAQKDIPDIPSPVCLTNLTLPLDAPFSIRLPSFVSFLCSRSCCNGASICAGLSSRPRRLPQTARC
jgi:hypothetical protein